jgi:hypothetical protein
MWNLVFDSVQGESHKKLELPCQDSCRAIQLTESGERILLLAVSDGAGSASHSQIGSMIACDAIIEFASGGLRTEADFAKWDKQMATEWCAKIRERIQARADELSLPSRQLACTLLFAAIGPMASCFLQIGDGAIVIEDGSGLRTVFWPQSGEYAAITNFITDPAFAGLLEATHIEGPLQDVAMFTDGIERLALRFGDKSVHSPFFEPLLRYVRSDQFSDQAFAGLRAFLDSPRVNERTDDDKTLILACRVSERHAQASL